MKTSLNVASAFSLAEGPLFQDGREYNYSTTPYGLVVNVINGDYYFFNRDYCVLARSIPPELIDFYMQHATSAHSGRAEGHGINKPLIPKSEVCNWTTYFLNDGNGGVRWVKGSKDYDRASLEGQERTSDLKKFIRLKADTLREKYPLLVEKELAFQMLPVSTEIEDLIEQVRVYCVEEADVRAVHKLYMEFMG